MTGSASPTHLVLYDGVCGLCDGTVQFLLEHDRGRVLSFAQLQGQTAASLATELSLPEAPETMVLIENFGLEAQLISYRSTAALRILARLGGAWWMVSWLRVIPRPIRDLAYDLVARFRYRWFGRFDSCKLPSPEARARFLD